YLYVQFQAQNTAGQPPIDAQVTLKDGTVWDADQGVDAAGIARDGWVQTSIKLPPGTKPSDVASIKFLSNGQASEAAVGHMYMFNQNYQPQEVTAPIRK
ncbi:MAG TPA: hypothetical protein V6D47_14695, partial [Oscillatoriaceae cyanobacterium]